MAFKWNGVHMSQLGVIASAQSLPYLPEPRTAIEEIHGRDGFIDFTEFNPARRVHYHPREWHFFCSLEMFPGDALTERLGQIAAMFLVRKGRLEADACPGIWWDAIITNRFDMVSAALNLRQFDVYFRSQPFARALDESDTDEYIWTGQKRVL